MKKSHCGTIILSAAPESDAILRGLEPASKKLDGVFFEEKITTMLCLLLAMATGLAWTLVAIFFGNAPKETGGLRRFFLVSNTVYLLLSLPGISLSSVDIHEFFSLAACIVASSLMECLGFFMLKFAMSSGNPGIAWCLGQSSMVVPFVGDLLFLGGRCTPTQAVGVAFLVATMGILGSVKGEGGKRSSSGTSARHGRFLFFAGAAFLCIGLAQFLRSIPSPENFSEAALGWRLPMVSAVPLLFWCFMSTKGGEKYPVKSLLLKGVVYGIFVALGQKLCLLALDAGAPVGLNPVVFPIAMGGSVLLYNLYCAIFLKERFTALAWTGIGTALVGMVGIMLK